MANPPPLMPLRGDRTAPTFDPAHPNTLPRFLTQVQRLLDRSQITGVKESKDYIISFVEPDLQDLWEAFPEYTDATKTLEEFKKALIHSYTDEDNMYDMRDLDQLIGERQRLGIKTLHDLTSYHLRFRTITSYLIEKKRLGIVDEFHAYTRGFNPAFWNIVLGRLHIKHPEHRLNHPYTIEQVYEAARFVLDGMAAPSFQATSTLPSLIPQPLSPTVPAQQHSHSPTPDSRTVKIEELSEIISKFSKEIIGALAAQQRARLSSSNSNQRNVNCNFCGKDHFICDCDLVEEYIRAGKCKRNIEGKVVLPSGAFVPRKIPGTLLRERVDEWHRRNPNQLAVPTSAMFHPVVTPPTTVNPVTFHDTYQLSASDRIAALEAELFSLKSRRPGFTPIIRTRAQKTRDTSTEIDDSADEPPVQTTQHRAPSEEPPHHEPSQPTAAPSAPNVKGPEHPFRGAQDAVYAPPQSRNVGAPFKPPANKKPDVAYRTLPPVHNPAHAQSVYERAFCSSVTLTHEELLSLAPEVRTKFREAVTSCRAPPKEGTTDQHLYDAEEETVETYFAPAVSRAIPKCQHRSPPPGALIIPDPIEAYYRSLSPGEQPNFELLTVAKESLALRSIYPLVDNNQKVESVLDPGCQIIAMSETVCHRLGVSYDPEVILHMLSANGAVDSSLGLARNVPFTIGNLTFYMQVHVIRSPAYEILLGRPFDVLTQSIVRNFANEDQTITVHDPNTCRTITIPTSPRRSSRTKHDEEIMGFRE